MTDDGPGCNDAENESKWGMRQFAAPFDQWVCSKLTRQFAAILPKIEDGRHGGAAVMRSYQCYLRDRFGVATVEIIESADDGDAKQQARELLARNDDRYRAVEVWNRARQVDVYPSDAKQPAFVAMMRVALMQE